MNLYTNLVCQVSNEFEFLMPLCSNQFFNDLTQSWGTSVTLYPTSKGMFGMLWFLCYTSPRLPRQETLKITVKIEKQSYRDSRTCRCQSRLYQFIKKMVIVKKSSPKNLSADCRSTVGSQLTDRLPTVYRQLTNRLPTG